MAAFQAQQGGKAPSGDILQMLGQAGSGAATDAARQSAVEQGMGQGSAVGFGLGQRGLERALAGAQQQAAWRNTQSNIGVGLQQQAALKDIISAGGQGIAAMASSGGGRNGGSGYDGAYSSDYYGDRGGPADLGGSSGGKDLGDDEWSNPYAYGGEVGDEERRAREFIASLRGSRC